MLIILFPNSLLLWCTYPHSPLADCLLPPVESSPTVPAYCRAPLWGGAGSQTETYLKPCSLCLPTLLLGAVPHRLGLALHLSSPPYASSDPNFPVRCMAGECSAGPTPSPLSIPLHLGLISSLILPWQHVFDSTLITCVKIAGGAGALGFFKLSISVEFYWSAVLQFRHQSRCIFKIYRFCFLFNRALNLNK